MVYISMVSIQLVPEINHSQRKSAFSSPSDNDI